MHLSVPSRLRAFVLLPLIMLLVSACSEITTGPFTPAAMGAEGQGPLPTDVIVVKHDGLVALKALELGACGAIAAPEGTRLSHHVFAKGVQVYRWTGASWAFVAPIATLYADAGFTGEVGTHYAGPTWESNSGSVVKAAVVTPCPVGGGNIPWLLLAATTTETRGVFKGVTHIQRVNTVGGVAPAEPGTVIGEERHVPYTAEYYFYRAK